MEPSTVYKECKFPDGNAESGSIVITESVLVNQGEEVTYPPAPGEQSVVHDYRFDVLPNVTKYVNDCLGIEDELTPLGPNWYVTGFFLGNELGNTASITNTVIDPKMEFEFRDTECTVSASSNCNGTLDYVTPISSPALCPLKNKGDADCDGNINLSDFNIFLSEYVVLRNGQNSLKESDFNSSNTITLQDFNIWREEFVNRMR